MTPRLSLPTEDSTKNEKIRSHPAVSSIYALCVKYIRGHLGDRFATDTKLYCRLYLSTKPGLERTGV